MKQNLVCLLAIVLSLACTLPADAATPTVGQPAPALTFTDLLHAPAGTKTDWPSLHGKVVVLEFWATWCAGCIEELPHLNALVQSLAPNNIQFIAVDDEDPAVVTKFLTKTPINGWLGIDTTKKIIDAYDANVRPRTYVIDTNGHIAAVLNPHQLEKDQLLALASGKPVTFPVDQMPDIRQEALKQAKAASDAAAAGNAGPKPLFDISIRPGDPAGRTAIAHRSGKNDDSYSIDYLNAPLQMLMQQAGGVPASRLVIHGAKDAKYSLHVSAPGGDIQDLAPAIQLAIITATGMKLTHVTAEEDAWILQPTSKAASLLPPATSDQGSMCFYNPQAGKLVMMQSSLDSLADTLEPVLGALIVNETGLKGDFDANFSVPKGDIDGARAALETNLGLTLVKARRSIDRVVLDPLPPAAEKAANQPAKPEPAPGQLIQSIAVPHQ
ncbi:MAG: redoxin domain-containing protein [Terracidiphilus sp.]